MIRILAGAVLAVAVLPAVAASQQQDAMQPGIVVVSSQKCAFDKLPEINQFWKENNAPVLDDLVRQGKLMGWGVLEHMWGDEWNNVVYYTARDQATFNAAFGEFWRTLMKNFPDIQKRFAGWCSEHRDNIYRVVLVNSAQPPMK